MRDLTMSEIQGVSGGLQAASGGKVKTAPSQDDPGYYDWFYDVTNGNGDGGGNGGGSGSGAPPYPSNGDTWQKANWFCQNNPGGSITIKNDSTGGESLTVGKAPFSASAEKKPSGGGEVSVNCGGKGKTP